MEDWIKDAFKLAKEESADAILATERVGAFLKKYPNHIVAQWAITLPQNTLSKMNLILKDKELNGAISDLCVNYMIFGYMLRKNEESR